MVISQHNFIVYHQLVVPLLPPKIVSSESVPQPQVIPLQHLCLLFPLQQLTQVPGVPALTNLPIGVPRYPLLLDGEQSQLFFDIIDSMVTFDGGGVALVGLGCPEEPLFESGLGLDRFLGCFMLVLPIRECSCHGVVKVGVPVAVMVVVHHKYKLLISQYLILNIFTQLYFIFDTISRFTSSSICFNL